MDAYHGYLDDVGSRALDGCVDGVPFGISAHHGVVAVDVGQIAAAMEDGLRVAAFACQLDAAVHIGFHAGIRVEVSVDELLGLLARDAHPLGQSEGADAVDDAEVGRLGLAPLVGRDEGDVLVEYLGCRGRMDVMALAEGIDEILVLAQMSHETQLDLRVVGAEEELPLVGDERLAYLFSLCVAHGDVLQVGVARRETSRGGDGLVERGVDVSRFGMDELRQGIDVCAQQLLQPPVFQDLAHYRVALAQALQHLLAGDVLSGAGLLGFS